MVNKKVTMSNFLILPTVSPPGTDSFLNLLDNHLSCASAFQKATEELQH